MGHWQFEKYDELSAVNSVGAGCSVNLSFGLAEQNGRCVRHCHRIVRFMSNIKQIESPLLFIESLYEKHPNASTLCLFQVAYANGINKRLSNTKLKCFGASGRCCTLIAICSCVRQQQLP